MEIVRVIGEDTVELLPSLLTVVTMLLVFTRVLLASTPFKHGFMFVTIVSSSKFSSSFCSASQKNNHLVSELVVAAEEVRSPSLLLSSIYFKLAVCR
jgi:hypothetical protein